MKVYYGKNKKKEDNVAIKIDKQHRKNSSVINEALTLTKLKEICSIPIFY